MRLMFSLLFFVLSASALAQTCYVDLIEVRSGRILRSFQGWGDNSCMEGMKECRKSIRFDFGHHSQDSLDCVKTGGIPVPTPVPQPHPLPGPRPLPVPPHPSLIEVNMLIQDLSGASINLEVKTKIIESMILNLNSYSLVQLVQICSPTRTWADNAKCLLSGVARAPREFTQEHYAIDAVAQTCSQKTKTYQEEKACFEIALGNNRFESLSFLAQSCRAIYDTQSSVNCLRSVFGVR